MAFQPAARHFNPRNASSQYDSFGEEDSSDEDYYDDDVPWYRRRVALLACGLVVLLAAAGVLLMSFRGGQEAPPPAPPPMKLPAPMPEPMLWPTEIPATTLNPLIPIENLHDSNPCADTEELYGGLCYKKCSILTDGSHPIRTSSWTCCESHPCGITNQAGSVGGSIMCDGFDVGDASKCPHAPGACLTDEELFLGNCYKKCEILTQGAFPTRVGPDSCCKGEGLGCLDPRQDKTSSSYAVGGGQGDHDASTPSGVHAPLVGVTEQGGVVTPATQAPTMAPGTGGVVEAASRCGNDEELYAGLCYKKCGLMTNNEYPIRTSSWTCCANHPCGLNNQKGAVGSSLVCNGFDIGGTGAQKIASLPCPHKPYPCRPGEEDILGVCYESCAQLTNGQFPHRTTAATCCKESGLVACLDPRNTQTSSGFNTE
eukprot:gb/GFBE01041348.1/.p1 GENE.gb/GFBE01041348.1/~~gb/GFBE01041348.1/.p1  ORF type:complete len:427 (+),score=53.97 gb/GFBE01041348.1/:1-1281(+)